MRIALVAAVAALALVAAPALAQGVQPSKPKLTPEQLAKQSSQRTLGYRACSFCYSCGGPWPYLAGTFYTPAPSYTVERGAYCSGALAYRSDSTPYLCCGVDQ
jgi:hypothetical protein